MNSWRGSALALGGLMTTALTAGATAQAYVPYLTPPAPVVAAGAAQTAAVPVSIVIIASPPVASAGPVILDLPPPQAAAVPVLAVTASAIDPSFTFETPAGWSAQEAADGRIRNLQAELMVGALRCHAMGIDVMADYNGFVDAARTTLTSANGELKARFATVYGSAAGQEAYDKFATTLANAFGSAATTREICGAIGAAARVASAASGSRAALLALADHERLASGLPRLDATVQLASR